MSCNSEDRAILAAIGDRLRELRDARGLTQEAVAEALGLQQAGTVSRYEGGHHDLSLSRLRQLAVLYEVRLRDIVDVELELPEPLRTPEEIRLVGLATRLDAHHRALAIEVLRAIKRSQGQ